MRDYKIQKPLTKSSFSISTPGMMGDPWKIKKSMNTLSFKGTGRKT
jgi:hypothetical protein